jgi:ADP-ribosyl-[dinitrogen reductase] hydrolase
MSKLDNIDGCFLGMAVGDALGVPVEFKDRDFLRRFPVTTMTGNGTWGQPAGTWSDDSSLSFCLAESLVKGYNLSDIGNSFVRWMKEGYWGAHHKVFDIGGTTRVAIQDLANGESPMHSGNFDEESNGNGSLMRIVPASIFFHRTHDDEFHKFIREISAVTHAHFRSVFSCFLFSKLVQKILDGLDKMDAYQIAMTEVATFASEKNFYGPEIKLFGRLLDYY